MPVKIKKAFEKEYGKKKGQLIFYKWEAKHKKLKDKIAKNALKFK